eukprot:TRINITY_DN6301_c0_g1_i4.p1 TRINITY_DN6301_c0_g1~~TRINITY_DN6301_c0_g1_i4.p1  ORF type:complete len:275 (+),score=25.24 TRINITY_DN6301_c0_g1_i4:123-947(+)
MKGEETSVKDKDLNALYYAFEYVNGRLRYQPASELRLESYTKCCESGKLLRYAAGLGVFGFAFVAWRRVAWLGIPRSIFAGAFGLLTYAHLDERRNLSCCTSVILNPDIPLARDMRDILRRNAPKHSLLTRFETQFPSQASEEQFEFESNPKAGVMAILRAELEAREEERQKKRVRNSEKTVVDAGGDARRKQSTRSSTAAWGTSDDDNDGDNIPTPILFEDEDSKDSSSSFPSHSADHSDLQHDDNAGRDEARRSRKKDNSERRRRKRRDDDD